MNLRKSANVIQLGLILMCLVITHVNQIQAQPMTEMEASKYTESVPVVQGNRITPNMKRVIYTPINPECPEGRKKDRRGRCRVTFV